jgi:hypothetical protein
MQKGGEETFKEHSLEEGQVMQKGLPRGKASMRGHLLALVIHLLSPL